MGNYIDYSWLLRAYDKNTIVKAVVGEVAGNGYRVKVLGVNAYLPFTQVDPSEKVECGNEVDVCVIKIMPITSNVIVSAVVAANMTQNKDAENLEIGTVFNGKVTKIIKYGVFVSFGEFIGFVHYSELSYINDRKVVSQVVQMGQKIPVKVISINKDDKSGKYLIGLSYKQAIEDPWRSLSGKVGDVVEGVVYRIEDYGLFVNLNGVSVLVHKSELPLDRKAPKPKDFAKIGDVLMVRIIMVDMEQRNVAGSVTGAM